MADIKKEEDLYVFEPDDAELERNRTGRFAVFCIFAALSVAIPGIVGSFIGRVTLNHEFMGLIFSILGAGSGVTVFVLLMDEFFLIKNTFTGLFVTQNELASLFSKKGKRGRRKINVYYGPGTHFCYPWERRLSSGNIVLEEIPTSFSFIVQCKDGTATIPASYRLRPDMKRILRFQSGAAGVASELEALIESLLLDQFLEKTVRESINSRPEINKLLRENFVDNDHELEQRFGVRISDVTIGTILPSDELKKTISGIAEAEAVFEATAKILGYSADEARKLRKKGKISDQVWQRASNQAMSITGNNENRQETGFTFDVMVNGVEGSAIQKMVDAGSNVLLSPGVQSALGAATNGKKPTRTKRLKKLPFKKKK